MFKYFTLDDFDFKGKVVGCRVDINSPIIDGKVENNERIKAHSKTVSDLLKKGAKVVILAHQGRKGDSDCISLVEHCKLLSKEVGEKIDFISEVVGKNVEKKIKSLKTGKALMIENLRFLDDETNLDIIENKIIGLQEYFDYYVIDAFSVAHRKQASITGISKVPLIAGRVMESEISGLNKISEIKRPSIYVLGGAKPDDLIEIIEANLSAKLVDTVILTGVIGEVALMTKGYYLGKKEQFMKEKGYLNSFDTIKRLVTKYSDKFVLPKDVAIFDGKKRVEIPIDLLNENKEMLDKYLIQDIGSLSVKFNTAVLKTAGSIYFKGPAGNFEDKNFEKGTSGMIKAITSSHSFTYMGGGHSVTAVSMYSKISDFSYVSLAGGALVMFLSGKKLPGVSVLEESFKKHDKNYEDFLVVGSNTTDIDVNVPAKFIDFHLGDKIRVEDDFKSTVGGGGINVSIALSRLGAKVGYLGKLSFENQDRVKDVLVRDKVRVIESKISKRPCAKSIVIDTVDDDRIILTYRGQNSYLEQSDFEMKSLIAKNVYFSSLSDESFKTLIEIAKEVKKRDLDSNICFNLSSHLIEKEKRLLSLVKLVDVLILNFEEAVMFTNKKTISDCLRYIKSHVSKLVVITDGANGAYAFDGEKEYFVKAKKPKKVVDTTGAGDCFAATFFYFYVKGYGIEKSLEMGAKNAANLIGYKGSQEGLLYYEDLVKDK